MKQFSYVVKDPDGIHARPAGKLVKMAQSLTSGIVVKCRGKEADMKKLLGLMSLGAKQGDTLSITVMGGEEAHDAHTLLQFLSETV